MFEKLSARLPDYEMFTDLYNGFVCGDLSPVEREQFSSAIDLIKCMLVMEEIDK